MDRMKYRLFSFFLFASTCLFSQNQNLVVNPSFENYTYPPIRTWPSATQPGQEILPNWVTPSRGTADFYNSDLSVCDGSPIAKARTGEGRVAILAGLASQNTSIGARNYKEYIQGRFTQPLVAGQKYCVKFYVALDRTCPQTTTGLGAYISPDAVRFENAEPLPCKPQIISHQLITSDQGWVEISGIYTANGGEEYITLGSFTDTSVVSLYDIGKTPNAPTVIQSPHITRGAYFYFDDVSVKVDDGKSCDCSLKKEDDRPGDYFLFLLDVSGSMNKSGHLDQMKSEIKRFDQSLNSYNKIGIMSFSDNAKMLMPFKGASDSLAIDSIVDKLKSHGGTNGDLAIYRVCQILDSMHLPQRTHVIIATDGIFNVTEKTKSYADSILTVNNTTFCVLQFGNLVNDDLEELTVITKGGTYNYVTKHNVPKILDQQLPPPLPDPSVVYYTEMATAVGTDMIDNIIKDITR